MWKIFQNNKGEKIKENKGRTLDKVSIETLRDKARKIQKLLYGFEIWGKVYNINTGVDGKIVYQVEILSGEESMQRIHRVAKMIALVLGVNWISLGMIDENKIEIIQPTDLDSKSTVKLDEMTGEDFELICAYLLENNGYENINLTRTTGDYGIDILADKEGIRYAIQCKYYSQPVGNKAVQEAYSGKTYYNCHVAVVLTNNVFTENAKVLAQNNGVLLWDRNKLLEMMEKL